MRIALCFPQFLEESASQLWMCVRASVFTVVFAAPAVTHRVSSGHLAPSISESLVAEPQPLLADILWVPDGGGKQVSAIRTMRRPWHPLGRL